MSELSVPRLACALERLLTERYGGNPLGPDFEDQATELRQYYEEAGESGSAAEGSASTPVVITVGDVTTEIGRLTLDPGETVQSVLPDLFRATADAIAQAPSGDRDQGTGAAR